MRTMGVKGLTLYHLKSHLQVCRFAILNLLCRKNITNNFVLYWQKYRLGKQSCKDSSDSQKDGIHLNYLMWKFY